MAPATSQRGFPAVIMGPRYKVSKSKPNSSKRAKHTEEARRCESVRSKMALRLTMDVDDADINKRWLVDVTQARY